MALIASNESLREGQYVGCKSFQKTLRKLSATFRKYPLRGDRGETRITVKCIIKNKISLRTEEENNILIDFDIIQGLDIYKEWFWQTAKVANSKFVSKNLGFNTVYSFYYFENC